MADLGAERDTDAVADDQTNDPVLEALWARALEAWDDDRAHAALLAHALSAQLLPELAGRYRALADDADRSAGAKKRLDAIVVAATSTLMAMKTPRPGKVPIPITLTAFAVSMLLLGYLAWAIWRPR